MGVSRHPYPLKLHQMATRHRTLSRRACGSEEQRDERAAGEPMSSDRLMSIKVK